MNILLEIVSNPVFWVAVVLIYTLKKGIHFVPQNRGYVIYRFGKYTKTLSSGLNFIVPYVESVAADRNLKEQTILIPQQSAITKDNIAIMIDGVLFIKVIDAAAATNNITDYKLACAQLAMTSMRNAIGSMELEYVPASLESLFVDLCDYKLTCQQSLQVVSHVYSRKRCYI